MKDYPYGTQLTMLCWKDDFNVRWFLIKTVDGTEGYVDEPSVSNQTTVDHCAYAGNVTKKVLAADWALSAVNQTYADAEVTAHYSGSGWNGIWAGYCYTFAHYAWYKGTGINPLYANTAIDAWNHYVNAGKAHIYNRAPGVYNQPPAYGSMVFWTYSNMGHVGIGVGADRVVDTHSPGAVTWENWYDSGRANNYLGWVPIESMDTN